MCACIDEPETQVFVLRCWRDADAVDRAWRVQVVHVTSDTREPVTDLGQLQTILGRYLQGDRKE